MIEHAAALPFVALLLVAAGADLARMEIPDWVSIVLAALYPPIAYALGAEPGAVALHLGVGLGAFFIGALAFQFGVMGGGDVKVLAAAGVWTGTAALAPFLTGTALAGGLLTVALLGARRFARPGPERPEFVNRLLKPGNGAPYAVAIAAGGMAVAPLLPIVSR